MIGIIKEIFPPKTSMQEKQLLQDSRVCRMSTLDTCMQQDKEPS